MKERRVAQIKKGNQQVRQLKFVVGCMLIGSVVAGALFFWVPIPFDIRIVGASIGGAAGLAANHLA
jgi:hypothetical protein